MNSPAKISNLRIRIYGVKDSRNKDYKILKGFYSGFPDNLRANGLQMDIIAPYGSYEIGTYTITGYIHWVHRYEKGVHKADCIVKPIYMITPKKRIITIDIQECEV